MWEESLARTRPRRDRQRLVLPQDRRLQLTQHRARADAELLSKRGPQPAKHCLAPQPIHRPRPATGRDIDRPQQPNQHNNPRPRTVRKPHMTTHPSHPPFNPARKPTPPTAPAKLAHQRRGVRHRGGDPPTRAGDANEGGRERFPRQGPSTPFQRRFSAVIGVLARIGQVTASRPGPGLAYPQAMACRRPAGQPRHGRRTR